MITAAWVLRIALLVHDAHGFTRAMPPAMASAIVDVAADSVEAATLVVLAFRESSYRTDVRGDAGQSCGAWQTPCSSTPLGDVRAQAKIAVAILRRSAALCPSHPLAIYASGSCTNPAGRRISDARIAEASALAVAP